MKRLRFETAGTISAIVVGMAALFIAWDQAQVMRKQQHASVWPLIEINTSVNREDEDLVLEFSITNAGVGPALIQTADLLIGGAPVETWDQFANALLPDTLRTETNVRGGTLTGILGAGQSNSALRLAWPSNEENDESMRTLVQTLLSDEGPELALNICYCSVFERCWATDDDTTGRPTPVKSCPDSERDFVQLLLSQIQERNE